MFSFKMKDFRKSSNNFFLFTQIFETKKITVQVQESFGFLLSIFSIHLQWKIIFLSLIFNFFMVSKRFWSVYEDCNQFSIKFSIQKFILSNLRFFFCNFFFVNVKSHNEKKVPSTRMSPYFFYVKMLNSVTFLQSKCFLS